MQYKKKLGQSVITLLTIFLALVIVISYIAYQNINAIKTAQVEIETKLWNSTFDNRSKIFYSALSSYTSWYEITNYITQFPACTNTIYTSGWMLTQVGSYIDTYGYDSIQIYNLNDEKLYDFSHTNINLKFKTSTLPYETYGFTNVDGVFYEYAIGACREYATTSRDKFYGYIILIKKWDYRFIQENIFNKGFHISIEKPNEFKYNIVLKLQDFYLFRNDIKIDTMVSIVTTLLIFVNLYCFIIFVTLLYLFNEHISKPLKDIFKNSASHFKTIMNEDVKITVQDEVGMAKFWREKYEETIEKTIETLNSFEEFIVQFNKSGTITFANKALLKISNRKLNDIIGTPISNLLPDFKSIEEVVKNIYHHKIQYSCIKGIYGENVYIKFINTLLYDKNGKTIEIVKSGKRCTENEYEEFILQREVKND